MPFQALQGVQVIEAATGVAGPFCGKLLADYGAEVIKVEQPGIGDSARRQGPFPKDGPHIEKSGLFLHLNANKKGITLDLEHPGGRSVFKRLVEQSHVLIESRRPGDMETLGLGYQVLRQLRPELVMTSVTPFGQTGVHKDYEFTELTIFAMTGAMYREGLPDRHPLKYAAETAQYYAGTAAAAVTTAACLKSSMTGQGEWIDIAIQECMAGHPHQIGRRGPFAYSGAQDARLQPRTSAWGGREPYAVGTFRCRDGYVSLLPLGARMWPNIARMIGRTDLLDDRRYSTSQDRIEHRQELEAIFRAWVEAHTKEEIYSATQSEGIPAGPVLTIDEVMRNDQVRARNYFTDIRHPDAGSLAYTGLPFRLSDAPSVADSAAPRLGQHTDEVLTGLLELENREVAELRQRGAI